jgi:hypothetical protein
MGAIHIQNCGIRKARKDVPPVNNVFLSRSKDSNEYHIEHTVAELLSSSGMFLTEATYVIRKTGVVQKPWIVDTTGAGDAFIGGYIVMQLSDAGLFSNVIQSALDFGSWVAGRKLEGPGARSALPKSSDVDEILGTSPQQVEESLRRNLLPFRAVNHS